MINFLFFVIDPFHAFHLVFGHLLSCAFDWIVKCSVVIDLIKLLQPSFMLRLLFSKRGIVWMCFLSLLFWMCFCDFVFCCFRLVVKVNWICNHFRDGQFHVLRISTFSIQKREIIKFVRGARVLPCFIRFKHG